MVALPEGAVPLVAGTVLALAGLTLVLSPLLSGGDASEEHTTRRAVSRGRAGAGHQPNDDDDPESALAALREIEFDRETGKLSDTDYRELKARYTTAAVAEMRGRSRAAGAAVAERGMGASLANGADPVEAAIDRARRNQRSCTACGPRPEPDALYCSNCGRYLPGNCGRCGAHVEQPGARFCAGCGEQLAAA